MNKEKIFVKDLIQDITFKSVFAELKQYRPGYALRVQVRQYGNLLWTMSKHAKNKERVIVRSNLLKILEDFLIRELKN